MDLVSDEDVDFYMEHGWFITPSIIPLECIEEAHFGFQRYCAGERDAILPISLPSDVNLSDETEVQQFDYLSLQILGINQLVHNKLIAGIAARLSGSQSIRLFHDQIIYKPGDKGGAKDRSSVGYHTDISYWKSCSSSDMLSAWVPLTESSKENGTMVVLDRSHLWEGSENLDQFHRNINLSLKGIQPDTIGINEIFYDVKPGQVCFHNCRTIHGSYHNFSVNPRISLAIHLQDDSNHYRRHFVGGKLSSHLTEAMCRRNKDGQPDFRDPHVYPQLWPAL